ncbi:TDP-N-acetylfucosamine:lipid II N-acetylfucosaminyltransferase [Vibrio maritimus]|uniref:TDP-N-acetylfucosamine:lipid II N-acetylfucosaminyltransferase n=1 Tax=Vibrio maritimus TaxID=990268 RepID=UPI0037356FC1
MKTLHVAYLDKFIPGFITLMRAHCPDGQYYFTYGVMNDYPYEEGKDSTHIERSTGALSTMRERYIPLLSKMYKAEKIVLHGLFDFNLIALLFFNPLLLKKVHWIIWGGDLYNFVSPDDSLVGKIKFYIRRKSIENFGFLLTYLDKDIELVREIYGAKGTHLECLMYTSNVYKQLEITKGIESQINIQVGNSSDPSNNHISALNIIEPFIDNNVTVHIPLSYGDDGYSKQVAEYVAANHPERVECLHDFMAMDEYLSFLGGIDIAIFNHDRQQAMGNIITLLGLGKTVYLRPGTAQWELFSNQGIVVRSIESFDMALLTDDERDSNMALIKSLYSMEKLISQYKQLFQ